MKYEEPIMKIIFYEKSVVVTLVSGVGGDISTWPPKKTLEIDDI